MVLCVQCFGFMYRLVHCRNPVQVRPLKNMMEYAGIDAARLEAMEERLKKDVLAEVIIYSLLTS